MISKRWMIALVSAALLASQMVFASTSFVDQPVQDDESLEITGIQIVSKSALFNVYRFLDQFEYTVSKERFSNRAAAANFCSQHGEELANTLSVYVLAISGGPNFDKDLDSALMFSRKNLGSGFMAWINPSERAPASNAPDAFMMRDGLNDESEPFVMADYNKLLQKHGAKTFDIPAICSKQLKQED
jgi:hypothetical protein